VYSSVYKIVLLVALDNLCYIVGGKMQRNFWTAAESQVQSWLDS